MSPRLMTLMIARVFVLYGWTTSNPIKNTPPARTALLYAPVAKRWRGCQWGMMMLIRCESTLKSPSIQASKSASIKLLLMFLCKNKGHI